MTARTQRMIGKGTEWGAGAVMLVAALLLTLSAMARPAAIHADTLNASGTWVSNSSVGGDKEGNWTLTASTAGTELTGSFGATGPCDVTQGAVFGSLNGGGDIHFGILYNEAEEAVFDGAVSGATASGTYTTKNGDAGRWTGTFPTPQ